jgi:hypothetical protein
MIAVKGGFVAGNEIVVKGGDAVDGGTVYGKVFDLLAKEGVGE